MKPIHILITIILLCAFSLKCKAQLNYTPPTDRERDAGYQLRLAAKHFKTGVIFSATGYVVVFVGDVAAQVSAYQSATKTPSDASVALELIGGLSVVTGLIYIIESYTHIGKAGQILSGQSKFSLGATNSGIGLRYRL